MNIFSLHGEWHTNHEKRLTSNILFFLHKYKEILLCPFLNRFILNIGSNKEKINKSIVRFQAYDNGKIPNGEIIMGNDTKVLIETKIQGNTIELQQMEEYARRLEKTSINYPNYYLLIITQTNQKSMVEKYAQELENKGIIKAEKIVYTQWKDVIELLDTVSNDSNNYALHQLMSMFLEEVESSMYNRVDIETLPIKDLHEVVLISQNENLREMALNNHVFWPYDNFSPVQFIAYYFTDDCAKNSSTISYFAPIKHIWHDVTIDEVLTSIPEFSSIPNYSLFEKKAKALYQPGSLTQFSIAITGKPIELKVPIKFNDSKKLHPNILSGKHTSLEKLLKANFLEDLI